MRIRELSHQATEGHWSCLASMSAYMSRLMSRRFDWLGHGGFSLSDGWCALSGSSDDDHVSCEDRINLYPAAPIRLATMLHTWTITKRGMGLIFGTAPSPSGHSVTHPTRQQTPPLGDEARWNC